jgi:hypothetical protein
MQPRGLNKAISYSSKSESKNTRRQPKEWTWWFIYQSSESPPRDPDVSVEEAWVAHQGPTPSRVSFNLFSHSTKLLLYSLCRWSGPSQTFPCLTITLGVLGWRLAFYGASPPRVINTMKIASQSSSAHKEDLTHPNLEFIINQSNLTKRCKGELTKAWQWVWFVGCTGSIQRREGGGELLYLPPKN